MYIDYISSMKNIKEHQDTKAKEVELKTITPADLEIQEEVVNTFKSLSLKNINVLPLFIAEQKKLNQMLNIK